MIKVKIVREGIWLWTDRYELVGVNWPNYIYEVYPAYDRYLYNNKRLFKRLFEHKYDIIN